MPSKKYSKKENSKYGFHKSYRGTDLIEKKHQKCFNYGSYCREGPGYKLQKKEKSFMQ